MLEGVVCVVVAAGIATLVFASSLVVMLARQGIANVFRGRSRSPSQTTHFGGRDLQVRLTESSLGSRCPGKWRSQARRAERPDDFTGTPDVGARIQPAAF